MKKNQPTKNGKRPTLKACRKLGKAFALIYTSDFLPVRLINDLGHHLADCVSDAQVTSDPKSLRKVFPHILRRAVERRAKMERGTQKGGKQR